MVMIAAARDYRYFTRTQVWEHHSGAGGLNADARRPPHSMIPIAVYSLPSNPRNINHRELLISLALIMRTISYSRRLRCRCFNYLRRQLQRPPHYVGYGWSRLLQLIKLIKGLSKLNKTIINKMLIN